MAVSIPYVVDMPHYQPRGLTMTKLIRLIILLSIGALLNACQSTPPTSSQVVFKDEALLQHRLKLTNPVARFDNGTLILRGGIWPVHKQLHARCGHIKFEIVDAEGVLLRTVTTDYSPCHLHYKPKARRTGYFSVVVSGIPAQQLVITARYQARN